MTHNPKYAACPLNMRLSTVILTDDLCTCPPADEATNNLNNWIHPNKPADKDLSESINSEQVDKSRSKTGHFEDMKKYLEPFPTTNELSTADKLVDELEQIRDWFNKTDADIAHGNLIEADPAEAFDHVDTLLRTIDRQAGELEISRLQLAGCGVLAMANTPESAAANRSGIHPDYQCAAFDDICAAVDREIKHRADLAEVTAQRDRLANMVGSGSLEVEQIRALWENANDSDEIMPSGKIGQIKTLLRIIDRQGGELDAANQHVKIVNESNDKLCADLAAAQARIAQLESWRDDAQQEINGWIVKHGAAQAEIERLTAENAAYSKHLHLRESK